MKEPHYANSQVISTMGDRLRYVREGVLRLKQADMAKMLGFRRIATISDYEKNKRCPDIDTLCRLADLGSVSMEWLLSGRGVPFAFPNVKEESIAIDTDAHSVPPVLPLYNESASAPPDKFPQGSASGTFCVCRIKFSKGLVAYKTEDIIFGIDKDDKNIVDGKPYAVWLEDSGLAIKRVFSSPDGSLELSDYKNDSEKIPAPADIKKDRFIVGRIKWAFSSL